MSKVTDALRISVSLAGDGKTAKAVDFLELTLNELVSVATADEISLLSRHAAVLCEGGLKDERRARRILRRALAFAQTDTKLLFHLATLYQNVGRNRVARNLLDRRRETDEETNNVGLQELIEVLSRKIGS